MGPPFLAYYGALAGNQTLLQMAFDNVRLYREALLVDGPTGPLWAHIFNETGGFVFNDDGIWATGNGWAALGAQRVQMIIAKSAFADQMTEQTALLQT